MIPVQLVFAFGVSRQVEIEAILNREPIVRQSILIRAASGIGSKREGMILLIEGAEEACKEAERALHGLTEKIDGKEKTEIILKIKEAESKAMEGFGSIFS